MPVIAGFVGARYRHRMPVGSASGLVQRHDFACGHGNQRRNCSGQQRKAGVFALLPQIIAFEGAKIECGMRGAQGAIDHVSFEDGVFQISVVGNQTPVGLCGSGLIDTVACLRKLGILDETGRLLTPEEVKSLYGEQIASHMTTKNGLPAFLYHRDYPNVYLTQKDIREVQLAKGAVAAGILLLEKHLGITHSRIDRVCIAGAFGNYMSGKRLYHRTSSRRSPSRKFSL